MKERIVRHTKEEIKKMKSKTDHTYVRNTSDKEIERQADKDPDLYVPTQEEIEKFKPVNKGYKHE